MRVTKAPPLADTRSPMDEQAPAPAPTNERAIVVRWIASVALKHALEDCQNDSAADQTSPMLHFARPSGKSRRGL